jgi:tetratricopeptide (TPR) repeat protein
MTDSVVLEGIIIPEPEQTHFADAARLLEQALQAGGNKPEVAYMVALAYKRQAKTAEARTALRKIADPDAEVWLQMGLLSLEDKQMAQAEQEFARAWQMNPSCYEVGYNLCFARLALGQRETCAALLPRVAGLAPSSADQRFLHLLRNLLEACQPPAAASSPDEPRWAVPVLEMTAGDEQRLLQLVRSLEHFETASSLLRTLALARPNSPAVQEANFEAVLVQGKQLADRCEWGAVSRLLAPLARALTESRSVARPTQAAFLNLLGCASAMEQDYERTIKYFHSALRLTASDARLHQNLALGLEWNGELDQADSEWNRFVELLDGRVPVPRGQPLYRDQLAFETLSHLAEVYSKKERWSAALKYLQQASRIRPQDADLLERLFHLLNQLKRHEDARRTLLRLRQLRPNDPQLDLYELDLHDTKSLDDIDRMLVNVGRILQKYPNDMRVEERAVGMVGNVIPLMGRLCDQLTEQMGKIIDQVRRLPNYQINWSAVRDVMRDLEDEFLKLRQITRQCLPLVTSDEHRRIIRELSAHIDRKIEDCRRLGR